MENPVFERIRREVENHPVVVFMRGSPVFPQCPFSAGLVQVLRWLHVPFRSVDVLTDPGLEGGLRAFADWPPGAPMLFLSGEFIGGCDILRELYESGQISALLSEKGIANDG